MSEEETVLTNTHQLLLDALRHREQEIFRYLAILGPAVGGFVWLLHAGSAVELTTDATGESVTTHVLDTGVFVVGTVSVLLLLLLGAVYSLALGYNYRYVTLQLAKLEAKFGIQEYMLKGWPRCRQDFLDRYKILCSKPWCTPPEIIKVFWWAFLGGIVGVASAACICRPDTMVLCVVVPVGLVASIIGLRAPLWFGQKLHDKCLAEPESWVPDGGGTAPETGEEENGQ